MKKKYGMIFKCLLLIILFLIPPQVTYAQEKPKDQFNGEVSYDDTDLDDMTDEEIESYQPINCNNYEITLDAAYKIHAVIEPDETKGVQDGFLNLVFSQGEESKGFYNDLHISGTGSENNEVYLTLQPGTYQIQVSLSDDEMSTVDYVLTLTYTKAEDGESKLKTDNATISFAQDTYELKIDSCTSYDDNFYDFFEELTIKSKLKYTVDNLTLKTSNIKIATVDKDGYINTHSAGTVILTAILPNGKKNTCKIIIPKPTYKINRTKATIYTGQNLALTITANPKNETCKTVWATSNNKIATISSKGKLVGKKSGTCTITAKLANGKKLTCKVTVKEKPEITDVSDYLNNANGLKKKQNGSFEFEANNGVVTYAKITDNGASFRGLSPGGINIANLLMMDYDLISTTTFLGGQTSYYKNRRTGDRVYITEILLVISEIEYYKN